MTDYFALLGEARRPWLDPDKLKEKYFALARERSADAELNEAYRILSDPKLRLQHLLRLEDADLGAGRDLPPGLVELFWNAGALFREIDRWAHQNEAASNSLSRALLSGERTKLEARLTTLDEQLRARYESELEQLQSIDPGALPNEINNLILRYDCLAYLTRLREQAKEKRLRLET